MAVAERRYTAEEFWELTSLPENEDLRLELEDGVIVDMANPVQRIRSLQDDSFTS